MNTTQLGRFGESAAAEFLRERGWKILARGYRCKYGEIDIIAENKEYFLFAEVKLRKNALYGRASDSVTFSKQRKLITTARMWLAEQNREKPARFDVIEIYAPQGVDTKNPEINWITDAFE